MGSTSFWGFSYPNLLLVFLNLLFLGTCYIFFRKCWDFLWVFILLFFCTLFRVSLLPRKFVYLSCRVRKRRYWIEVRTVLNVKTTTTTSASLLSAMNINNVLL